jgi:hypothetical protein
MHSVLAMDDFNQSDNICDLKDLLGAGDRDRTDDIQLGKLFQN